MKRHHLILAAGLSLAALYPSFTSAQPITLPGTWGQYDLQEAQGYGTGLQSLTGESSSGFTAMVSSNGIAVGADYPNYNGYPSKSQYLPRVYAIFAGQPITNNGQRVTFSFDVKFNTIADPSNTGSFRISMGDTNCNNSWGEFFGIGASTSSTFRYDSTIKQDTNFFDLNTGFYSYVTPSQADPTNYSFGSFGDFNGNSVGGGGVPNGVKMGTDTSTIHHIRFSVERTPSGLQVDSVWSNSAGSDVQQAAFAPVAGGTGDDHNGGVSPSGTLPWAHVNVFGFCLFGTGANEHFFGFNPGSYTISNLKAYSGFNITNFKRDAASGDVLTWESTVVDVCQYVVETSSNLSSWTPISTNATGGYTTSYTNSPASPDRLYYRVTKQY